MSGREQDNPWAEPSPESPRPHWGLFLLFLLVLGGALAIGVYILTRPKPPALDEVSAVSGRLTLKNDDKALKTVDRSASPEVWYRVELDNVPHGTKLALVCEWIGPDGKVLKRNRYQTRAIDATPWPTHARQSFGPSSPPGKWTVQLKLEERVLHSLTFEVRDGKKGAP
jgi:hypothetical protein